MNQHKVYHFNGNVKQERIADKTGASDFILMDYFDDGGVKQATPFKGGMVHGYVKTNDKMQQQEVASYKFGMVDGPWTLHHKGVLIMAAEYKAGKLVTKMTTA
jgi:antitoxin component YwqK of YwqJK toxin-antitoxin module